MLAVRTATIDPDAQGRRLAQARIAGSLTCLIGRSFPFTDEEATTARNALGACAANGPWIELHVDFAGTIYKSKPADAEKWGLAA